MLDSKYDDLNHEIESQRSERDLNVEEYKENFEQLKRFEAALAYHCYNEYKLK